MNRHYCFFVRLWQWLLRFRHRCGYGIHSPFAFQWVNGVVYCQEAYYAYAPLSQQRSLLDGQLSEKDDQLLFRLANHQKAQRILLVGTHTERSAAYVQAARPQAEVQSLPLLNDLTEAFAHYDMIVVSSPIEEGLPHLDHFLSQPTPPHAAGLLVLCGIAFSPAARQRWAKLQASSATTICFDLYRIGVAYLRPDLNKQQYLINYF